MKTKILFIIIILCTVTAQAQIPTLAERNFSAVKSIKDNEASKQLSDFITNGIVEIVARNKQLESVMLQKNERLNSLGIDVDTVEKNNLLKEVKRDSVTIDQNKKIVEALFKFQKDIEADIPPTKREYTIIYHKLYCNKIKEIKAEIKAKKKESKTLNDIRKGYEKIAEIKSLNKQIEDLDRELKNKNGTYYWFPSFPSRNSSAFFENLYNIKDNKTSFLNSAALNYSDLGAVIQSEVIADTFWAVRTSFGTLLQSNQKTPKDPEEKENQTQSSQLETLLNGGGNFYIQNQLPVYSFMNEDITLYTFFNNRTAFGIKGLNDAIDTNTFNSSLGANLYFGLNSTEKKFNVFLVSDFSVIAASKSVYDNLQLAKKQPFFQGRLMIGVTFLSQFRVAATLSSFGSDEAVRSGKVTVGIQIVSK
ncbi:hypothetical protein [Flavobacterium lipolyticum]|uniref:Uncharacterized protein n=1 Tax=Flavobacterium lipolyticum TaxID=2893754 RepID=A0ABS8LUW4_9FLAO|nr:hypothetical protein [Flavobacterium sp. F-126]MCC9016361.1 hypothetical protein [Flavobacterium sp. F-126]